MEFFKFLKKEKPVDDKTTQSLFEEKSPRVTTRTASPGTPLTQRQKAAPRPRPKPAPLPRPTPKKAAPSKPTPNQTKIEDKHNRLSSLELTMEEGDLDSDVVDVNKRKHVRINRGSILDDEIKAYCRNSRSGQNCTALIIDISPGGMLLLSDTPFEIGDQLLISCKIGANFKMKENAVTVRLVKGRKYGVEFRALSENSKNFLTQLYGAVTRNT